MPMETAAQFIEAMPRLHAEEALHAVNVAAMGGGLGDQGDRSRILGAWERQARAAVMGANEPRPLNPIVLASMGIGVVEVKRGS